MVDQVHSVFFPVCVVLSAAFACRPVNLAMQSLWLDYLRAYWKGAGAHSLAALLVMCSDRAQRLTVAADVQCLSLIPPCIPMSI